MSPVDQLIASSSEAAVLLDDAGRLLFAAAGLGRLLGHDPVELVGRSFVKLVTPSDRPAALELLPGPTVDLDAPPATLARTGTVRLVTARGGSCPLDLEASPLIEANRVVGALITCANEEAATAIAAARTGDVATFRSSAQICPHVLFLLDAKGGCAFLGDRWTELTGQSIEEGLGVGWLTHVDDRDRKELRSIAGAAHTRGVGWQHRFRLRDADGSTRVIEVAAEPLGATPVGEGPSRATIGLLVDVTAEVRLAEEAR